MSIHNRLTLFTLALAIAGCGGSPSSSTEATSTNPTPVNPTPTTPASLSVASMQGIWRSPIGSANNISAIALPDGKYWALVASPSSVRMIKASFNIQNNALAATGTSYNFDSSATSAVSLISSVIEKTSLTGSITTGTLVESVSMAYQNRYDTPASLTDFVGAFRATVGPGTVNWSIDSKGTLTGTRTTGCTYIGQISLRAEKVAVVDTVLTETCAGVVARLSGVAVKNEDKQGITMLMTNADESAAVAVILSAGS
jgi:hypothetical protein